MNIDKESKSWIFFYFLGRGGGGGGREVWEGGGGGEHEDVNTRAAIFYYTKHTGMASSTEPYSLMKILLMVFKRGQCSFNHQGKITQKV